VRKRWMRASAGVCKSPAVFLSPLTSLKMSRKLDAAAISAVLFDSSDSDNSPQQSRSSPKKATVVDSKGACYVVNSYHLEMAQDENEQVPYKKAVVNLRGGSKDVTVIAVGSKYIYTLEILLVVALC